MKKFVLFILVAVFLFCSIPTMKKMVSTVSTDQVENKETEAVIETPKELADLHARSALLMDADNGRVLFEKNGYDVMPMASTTKIMSCIVALENGNVDDIVTISQLAAKQPDVQLNLASGEKYTLKDLLYSLMLESHNDSAVAIAEHIGGSVEGFAELMNQKARDLGAFDSYFITPNGLDAKNEVGEHSTTAEDLANILRYAIQNPQFLEITRTPTHTFSDTDGKRSFTVNNKNALLNQMQGAISGKTGFTGNAGFCYAGVVEQDGKKLIGVVLACGWPPNKTWKWADIQKLMSYGFNHYTSKQIFEKGKQFLEVPVRNGQKSEAGFYMQDDNLELLLREDEKVKIVYDVPKYVTAPVQKGSPQGCARYYINEELYRVFPIYIDRSIEKTDFRYFFQNIIKQWLLFQ